MSFPIDWSTYLPNLDDIPAAEQTAEWELVRAASQAAFPDLDVRPGTPFADLHLIPSARQRAALRVAVQRLLSDFDLSKLQQGIIYNCDFVEAYLASLGVSADRIVPATGVLLLQFTSVGPFSIPSSVVFGEGDTALQISGTYDTGQITFGVNGTENFKLFRLNETTWAAEVPVHGTIETDPAEPEPLDAGTTLGVDTTIEGLSAIVTSTPIDPGYPPLTLKERANLVPKLFPGLNTNTPAGLIAWVLSIFPATQGASPVVDGDVEMVRRNPNNIFGLVDGKTDLYIRGHSIISRTLTLPISRVNGVWTAELDAGSPILKVEEVRLQATGDVIPDVDVISTSLEPDVLPTPSAGFSSLEQLSLEFTAEIDVANQIIVEGADPYAFFEVDVLLDPHVTQVEEKLKRRDFAPVSGDVLVRPFIPVFLTSVKIYYRRNSGKEIRKEEAREEIVDYLMSAAYPDAPEIGGIAEIAMFWGARGVTNVEYTWSASLTPATIQEDAQAVRTNVVTYSGISTTGVPDTWAAGVGPRNTCPIVFPEAVQFFAVV